MKKVCVMGAGTMGLDIAQVFATKGFEVTVRDISDEIRRDLRLEETQRTLMLDYITQLNRVAQKQRRCLYIQGAKDCVQLLRSLGVIK